MSAWFQYKPRVAKKVVAVSEPYEGHQNDLEMRFQHKCTTLADKLRIGNQPSMGIAALQKACRPIIPRFLSMSASHLALAAVILPNFVVLPSSFQAEFTKHYKTFLSAEDLTGKTFIRHMEVVFTYINVLISAGKKSDHARDHDYDEGDSKPSGELSEEEEEDSEPSLEEVLEEEEDA